MLDSIAPIKGKCVSCGDKIDSTLYNVFFIEARGPYCHKCFDIATSNRTNMKNTSTVSGGHIINLDPEVTLVALENVSWGHSWYTYYMAALLLIKKHAVVVPHEADRGLFTEAKFVLERSLKALAEKQEEEAKKPTEVK